MGENGQPPEADRDAVTTVEVAGSAEVVVPEGGFIFAADFTRQGSDLLIEGRDGEAALVEGYFAAQSKPVLTTPAGAQLTPDLVEALLIQEPGPLQLAQAAPAAAAGAIGQVEQIQGAVQAIRAGGASARLNQGDPVFQGDVIQTAANSTIGITFVDGTVFSLSPNARMTLDELVYSAGGGNSMTMSILTGTFAFITGQVAPTGNMTVNTPVAAIGIRGTTLSGEILSAAGDTRFVLRPDPDGSVGIVALTNAGGQTILDEAFETVTLTSFNTPHPPTSIIPPAVLLADPAYLLTLQILNQSYELFQRRRGGDEGEDTEGGGTGGEDESGALSPEAIESLEAGSGGLPSGTGPVQTALTPVDPPDPVTIPGPPLSGGPGGGGGSGGNGGQIGVPNTPPSIPPPPGPQPPPNLTIIGTPGNDVLSGGAGNDTIIGGAGIDTAVFSGTPGQYQFAPGSIIVTGPDGTDTLREIEILRFVGENPPVELNVPRDIALSGNSVAENSAPGTVVGTLSALDLDLNDVVTFELLNDAGGRFELVGNQLLVAQGVTLDFEAATSFTIEVRATDSVGLSETALLEISVLDVNDNAPVAVGQTVAIDENSANGTLVATVAASDADGSAPNNQLNFAIVSGNDDGAFTIDAATGEITVADSTQLDFEIVQSFALGVQVTDGGTPPLSDSVIVTVNLNDLNESPIAVDDPNIQTAEDTAVTIAVLDNDSDPDGDSLQVTSVGNPQNGTVQLNSDGSITYTPNADFSGNDSFTYTIDDGNGGTNSATVSVTVTPVNDPPSLDLDADDSSAAGTGFQTSFTTGAGPVAIVDGDVLVQDVDDGQIEGATIRLTNAQVGDVLQIGGTLPPGISIDTGASSATELVLVGTASLADYQEALAALRFTNDLQSPDATPRSIEITVNDGDSDSNIAVATIDVVIANRPPVALDDTFSVDEDTLLSGTVLTNDSDPDGDPLSVLLEAGPTNGSLILNADGTFDYTPDPDFNGTDSFTYILSDGLLTSPATVTITVDPVNDAPVLATNAGVRVNQGETVVLGTADLLSTDVDNTAGDLTYSLDQLPADGTLFLGATALGVGESFTQADIDAGLVSYQHGGVAQDPSDSFSFTVSDGFATLPTAVFDITVVQADDPPVIESNAGLTLDEGATADILQSLLLIVDSDTPADQIRIELVSGPANGDLQLAGSPLFAGDGFFMQDILDGVVSYAHNGSETTADSFVFRVSDGTTTLSDATFDITINPVNDPPEVTTNQSLTLDEGASAGIGTGLLQATDPDNLPAELTYTISAPTLSGQLLLNGQALGQGGSFTQADIDQGLLSYAHDGSETTQDSFTFDLSDGNLGTSSQTFTITVRPVDDAPVLETNDGLRLDEGATQTIEASLLSASDIDTPASSIVFQITDLPDNGEILVDGDPIGSSLSFTQADLDAGLVEYRHFGDENSSDSFSFTVSDGTTTLGTATFQITVDPVNDIPDVPGGQSFGLPENTAAGTVVGPVIAEDPDPGDSLTFAIIGGNVGDAFAIDGATGVITVNNADALDFETTSSFDLQVRATDSAGATGTATVTIDLSDVNEAPSLDLNGADGAVFTEDDANGAFVDADLDVLDPDAGDRISSAQVQIQGLLDLGQEFLAVDTTGTAITASYDQASGILTLSGDDSIANYRQVLQSLTYQNNSQAPSGASRNIAYQVTDSGGLTSALVVATVVLVALNDAPVLAAPGQQSVTDPADLVFSAQNGNAISVSDVDAGPAAIQVSLSVQNGVLTLASTAGLTFTAGGNGTASMTFTGSQGSINVALDGLSYNADDGFSGQDDLTITVDDLGNSGGPGPLSDSATIGIAVGSSNLTIVGDDTVESLAISAGQSFSTQQLIIGNQSSGQGTVLVDGVGAKLTVAGGLSQIVVGNAGIGFLTVRDGGEVDPESVILGAQAGSIGTVAVDNATFLLTDEAGTAAAPELIVGQAGQGILNILNGGSLTLDNSSGNAATFLGAEAGGVGTVAVTGDSSRLVAGDFLGLGVQTDRVSDGGSGNLTLIDGGRLEADEILVTNGSNLQVVSTNAGGGLVLDGVLIQSLTVQGGSLASSSTPGDENIIRDGGFYNFDISGFGAEPAAVTVTGDGSRLLSIGPDNAIGIGASSASEGFLQVLDGGRVEALFIDVGREGAGNLVISGDGSVFEVSADLGGFTLGFFSATTGYVIAGHRPGGEGTIEVLDGGRLVMGSDPAAPGAVDSISPLMDLGSFAGSRGSLLIDGGTVVFGQTVAPNTAAGEIAPALFVGSAGDGTLTVTGSGQLNGNGSMLISVAHVDGGTGAIVVDGQNDPVDPLPAERSSINLTGNTPALGGTPLQGPSMHIGMNGFGTLDIVNGGLVSLVGEAGADTFGMRIGGGDVSPAGSIFPGDGTGLVTVGSPDDVFGGTPSQLRIEGGTNAFLTVGRSGEGTLIVQGRGQVRVDGEAAVIEVARGAPGEGRGANGDLLVIDGGRVALSGADAQFIVGRFADQQNSSDGLVLVQGASSNITVGGDRAAMVIGGQGQGELRIIDDARVQLSGLDTQLTVGEPGSGEIKIGVGGDLTVSGTGATGTVIGGPGGQGAVTVNGSGSLFDAGGSLSIGLSGEGSLRLGDGGQLQAGDVRVGAGGSLEVLGFGADQGLLVDGTTIGGLTVEGGGRVEIRGDNIGDFTTGPVHFDVSGTTGTTVTVTGSGSNLRTVGINPTIQVGRTAGSDGTLIVEDGATIETLQLEAGRFGTGTIEIRGGSAIVSPDFGLYGLSASEFANEAGFVRVGRADSGDGTIRVLNGGLLEIRNGTPQSGNEQTFNPILDIARDNGSRGTVEVANDSVIRIVQTSPTGTDPELGPGPEMTVGRGGTGVMLISGGSQVILEGPEALVSVGRVGGSDGDMVISGSGRLEINGGDTSAELVIGRFFDSDGFVEVTGPDSEILLAGSPGTGDPAVIFVGEEGTGELQINDGARVTGATFMAVGFDWAGDGTVVVSGLNGNFASTLRLEGIDDLGRGAFLLVGVEGTGSVQVRNAGQIVIDALGTPNPDDEAGFVLGGSEDFGTGGSGEMIIDGPGSSVRINGGATFFAVGQAGSGRLEITNGGRLTLENNQGPEDATGFIAVDPGSNGTVIVDGTNSLIDAGDGLGVGLAFDGFTDGGVGTLTVTNGGVVRAGQIRVGGDGKVTGDGTLDGELVVLGGTVEPGASAGILTVGGLTLDGGEIVLELLGTGQADRDLIDATGAVSLNRGILEFAMGIDPGINSFEVITSSAGVTLGSDVSLRLVDVDVTAPLAFNVFVNQFNNLQISFDGGTLGSGVYFRGGTADDVEFATQSADRLEGGAGNDLLVGLGGDDQLAGQAGNDLFLFFSGGMSQNGTGADTIANFDFVRGQDLIEIVGIDPGQGGILDFSDLQIQQAVLGQGVLNVITLPGTGNTISLLTSSALNASDFLLRVSSQGDVQRGSNGLSIGNNQGQTGVVTADDGAVVDYIGSFLDIGAAGTGTLNIRNGAQVEAVSAVLGGNFSIGGGTGQINVDGPESQLRLLSNQADNEFAGLFIAQAGNASINITDGGQVFVDSLGLGFAWVQIGAGVDSVGQVTVSGVGSSLIQNGFGQLVVGASGDGILRVINGAEVQAFELMVGDNQDSIGEVLLDGPGSVMTIGDGSLGAGGVFVGGFPDGNGNPGGQGSMTVSGGARLNALNLQIGRGGVNSPQSDMTITGPGSTVFISNEFGSFFDPFELEGGFVRVARNDGDTGRLTIEDGGQLLITTFGPAASGPGLQIAREIGSSGSVTVTGDGSLIEISSDNAPVPDIGGPFLTIGRQGDGQMVIADGATVRVVGDDAFVQVSRGEAGGDPLTASSIDLNTLETTGSTLVITSGSVLEVDASLGGVAVFNIAQQSSGDGAVLVRGPGSAINFTGPEAFFQVGRDGVGSLTIDQQATIAQTNGLFLVGTNAGSQGSVLIDNATLSLTGAFQSQQFGTLGATVIVGDAGSGTMEVRGGGQVTIDSGSNPFSGFDIGGLAGGVGAVTVTGQGSAVTISGDLGNLEGGSLDVGRFGDGTLRILDGGLVANDDQGITGIARETGSKGFVEVTGSGSTESVFDAGAVLVIGQDYDFDADIPLGPGTGGDGVLELGESGVVRAGLIDVGSGGRIRGIGRIETANLNMTSGAIAAGLSIGLLTIDGLFNLAGGTVETEIEVTQASALADEITVIAGPAGGAGTANLADGILRFDLTGADGLAGATDFVFLSTDQGLTADANNLSVAVTGVTSGFSTADFALNFGATDATFTLSGPIAAGNSVAFFGSDRDDFFVGGDGDDQLFGGGGNDVLRGGAGNDQIFGEGGDDELTGDAGDDTLDGGPGSDLLSYLAEGGSQGILLDLEAQPGTVIDTFGDTDTIAGFERYEGSGNDDSMIGGAGAEELIGAGGDDTLDGRAGNDLLRGGRGADDLTGGDGDDRFFYAGPEDGGEVLGNVAVSISGVSGDSLADFDVAGDDTLVIDGNAFGVTAVDASNFGTIVGEYDGTNGGGSSAAWDNGQAAFIRDGEGNLIYDDNGAEEGYTIVAQGAEAVDADDFQVT